MAEDLDAISNELALPKFRVPAPKNSAQHAAATAFHSRPAEDYRATLPAATPPPVPPPAPPVKNPTRQLIRDPQDWQPTPTEDESPEAPSQFAGIDIGEFAWERQRARRSLVFWVLIVLLLTGGVAAAGWTLGSNLTALI
jgi:serine/threonine-protein kinase